MQHTVYVVFENNVVYCVCDTLEEAKDIAVKDLAIQHPPANIEIEAWYLNRPLTGDWGAWYYDDGRWRDVDTGLGEF